MEERQTQSTYQDIIVASSEEHPITPRMISERAEKECGVGLDIITASMKTESRLPSQFPEGQG
ncbi:MAG: hypothetical protein ACW99J_10515 [Candidatus Thorarchaeota archaeon]|jgi:hypothetical protein